LLENFKKNSMKNATIATLFCAISFAGFAQENKQPTLEINGQAQMSVMPDEAIFSITVNQENADFGIALDQLNTKISALKKELKSVKIEDENIKTTNYSINENWKYENGKRYQDGYKAMHSIRVHIKFDKETMKTVYGAIRDSKVEVNMRLSFGLSDRKKYEAELMQMAVKDAKTKAMLLVGAADMEVIGIKKIIYGGGANHQQPRTYNMAMDAMSAKSRGEANIDVTPGAITLSDRVFVIFELTAK
tara:strand:- start:68524 stop:69264 length:741 start_codon:yes stop_codon:yes gene_type:complete